MMIPLNNCLPNSLITIQKNQSGLKSQTERALVLFELYPDIQKPYDLAQGLRNIFETTDKIIALGD
jgi:hypothetical protein